MQRSLSIITTCKGRLEHLKQTLPRMIESGAYEVVVVDFSCPDGTAAYVSEHFPSVRVVSVEGQTYFSNWKARNAGAAAATSNLLVFCDADTIVAERAVAWLRENLPPRNFGFLERAATLHFNKQGLPLAANQLRGFHVVPAAAFRRASGYDELFEGYAAGADTDLESRLSLLGLNGFSLDPSTIVEDVIQHDNDDRMRHHRAPINVSYGTGLIYRIAKFAVLKNRRTAELPLKTRRLIYKAASEAATRLQVEDNTKMALTIAKEAIGMPRQLGFESAAIEVTLQVRVSGKDRIDKIPD